MVNKYLPIGSVVDVNGIARKIMIVGYYSLEYNNSVKMYDYVGVSYPEGMLLKNTYSFNHGDITRVDFMGYPSEDYHKLNNGLLQQQITTNNEELQTQQNFVNLKFDENGVVVYEELSSTKEAPQIIKNGITSNPFEVKTQVKQIGKKPKFSFDENGVITDEIDAETEGDIAKIESNFKFGFDANGVITEETDISKDQTAEVKPVYKFDANGFIIDDGTNAQEENKQSKPVYQFNADGVIIGDSSETSQGTEEMPSYHFGEDGITING